MFSPEAKARFMEVALAQSASALPACRPNPPVGCVIVHGDTVVARGFTGIPGRHHAEVAALAELTDRWAPVELALFVTLEPCSFHGRTPSCAMAIVRSGIRQVFVGTIDTDPRNQGRGLELMRDAGLSVEVGVAEARVLAFIAPYLLGSGAGPP
jgi:pyrimidine deaminase RibD-like protein